MHWRGLWNTVAFVSITSLWLRNVVLSFVDLHDNPKIPFRDYMPFLTQCQEWKGTTKVSMTSMKVLLMNFIVLLSRNNQKRKILLFASSLRHVKNIDKMLQCEQCGSWRLLYCEQKVTKKEREREPRGRLSWCFVYSRCTSAGPTATREIGKCLC